jgi:hypothetical protein
MLNLQIAGHVRHQEEGHGGVIVLDTATGCWLALNATAGEFWRSWGGGSGFDDTVASVAAAHPDVPLASVRADAERLLDELFSLGLIEAVPTITPVPAGVEMAEALPEPAGPQPGWTRIFMAFIFLVAAAFLVRCSFRFSYLLVRASRRKWCRGESSLRQARTTVTAVSRAARRYPGRAACLEQSLAAVMMAAAARRRLDWCLGSAPDPYRFHAWVEVAGQAVAGPGELWSQFDHRKILLV